MLASLVQRLALISESPALDASVLLAHVVQKPRSFIIAHPEIQLTAEQQQRLNDSLAQLENGEPFPYVLGSWEFFGLEFEVNQHVLIPRPETELLVEKAIAWIKTDPQRNAIADIGTGSGAIAVSLAMHLPHTKILATDISPEALATAKRNAEKFHVHHQIEFVECDLFPKNSSFILHPSSLHLICANLPYIPTATLQQLPIYNREPTLALDGGKDGLDLYRKLFSLVPNYLAPHGLMLFEIEATQGIAALNLAADAFPESSIQLHQDLAGKDRLLEILI